MRDELKQIGIDVEVQTLSDKTFPDDESQETAFPNTMGLPVGDASDILDDVFHSDDSDEFGGNNVWFFDPKIDRAIETSGIDHRRTTCSSELRPA